MEVEVDSCPQKATIKGIGHPKIKNWSSFTHIVLNIYDSLSTTEHKRRHFEELLDLTQWKWMETRGVHAPEINLTIKVVAHPTT